MSEFVRYLPAIIWILLLSFVLTKHVKVYRLYDTQLKIVRRIEYEGGIEDGSTLVAINQRVRYIIRIFLAVTGIGIGIAGVYGTYDRSFGNSVAFGIALLVYFYSSEIATGYLTIRDERVIARILEIDAKESAAALTANTRAVEANTAALKESTEALTDE